MKRFLAMALAMCMALPLCSCAATEEKSVSLRVSVGDHQDLEWLQTVIDDFTAARPDRQITVTPVVISEGDARSTVLADPEAAPDVFTFADDQFNDLLAAGVLQEVLTDQQGIMDANGGAHAGPVVASTGADGKLYAYPATASNGYYMMYDRRYFNEEDVQSLERMLEIAAENGKKVGFPMTDSWYLYSFFQGAGLEMHLAPGSSRTNVCNWNATDTPITGVEVAEAILAIAAHPGYTDSKAPALVSGLQDGSIIAGVSGTWDAQAAIAAWGEENFGAAKLPTYTVAGQQAQMGSFAGYKLVGVNAYSPAVFDALDFAAFMTGEQNQLLRFRMRQEGPSNRQAAGSAEVQAAPSIAALAAQSAYADVQRVGDNYWTSAETLGKILSGGNPEGVPLQTLLDNAVAGITAPAAD